MRNELTDIDTTIPRRKYHSADFGLAACPECGSELIKEKTTILLFVRSEIDEGEFATSLSGSHFCRKCPVVVFDTNKVEQAAKLGIRGGKNIEYSIAGIINLDSIPEQKRHLEIGSDENPMPIVDFLPDRNISKKKKPGRNDPCFCGSGIKYKKCCGR